MSKDKNKDSKSATPIIAGVLLVLAVIIAGGLYASTQKEKATETAAVTESAVAPAAGEESAAPETATDEALEAEDEQVQAAENAPEATAPAEEPVSPVDQAAEEKETAPVEGSNLAALSTPRILGNPDSPVKISEHSSFTCGACAHYHGDNFKKLKADYVDTGKARIVFDDFPRNVVDLEIGMVARCLPESSYFNFIQLLFETQEKWAKEEEYKKYVKQNAMLAGLDDAKYEECINNAGLQKSLADNREAASAKFGIKGTPTLVINDSVVISGLAPYSQIKDALDAELAKATKK